MQPARFHAAAVLAAWVFAAVIVVTAPAVQALDVAWVPLAADPAGSAPPAVCNARGGVDEAVAAADLVLQALGGGDGFAVFGELGEGGSGFAVDQGL